MNTTQEMNKQKGFTLIEILVVIGIIAVLAAVVLIAINPARQFAQARNSQRTSNVNAILNGIGQRMADNKGIFNGTFSAGGTSYTCPTLVTGPTTITTAGGGNGDLSCLVPTYIPAMPTEPTSGASGYTVAIDAAGRVTIAAPSAELGATISITR